MMVLFYSIGAVVFLFVILVIIAPKHYDVKRSILINKSKAEVFQYLKFIKNQDDWSPWKKKDPNIKQSYIGDDGTVGL